VSYATGYRLAASLGIECADAMRVARADVELPESVPFEHVLAVRRFDRTPAGGRAPRARVRPERAAHR